MSHIIFAVVYHPPDAISHVTTTHIIGNIDAITRQHSCDGSVIVGDFNKMTEKPLRDIGLKQVFLGATRKSATLDKIYTNINQLYLEPSVLPNIALSDHRAVKMLPTDSSARSAGHPIMVTV